MTTLKRTVFSSNALDQLNLLSPAQRQSLKPVADIFPFKSNSYYLSLIDWNDPDDPIRRIIVPTEEEMTEWGVLDPSDEQSNTIMPGVQHKYHETALLMCSNSCSGQCRYCFRKRLFLDGQTPPRIDLEEGIRYIASQPQITNVLLTGGDPFMLSTAHLVKILRRLRQIEHVRVIRIGSKMPAFNPMRISEDEDLLEALAEFSTPWKRIYLIAHFDHPRELTDQAVECIDRLIRSGVICCNQCPMVAGVNDDSEVLSELFTKLAWIGCPPYYVFQMRPTVGNRPYAVPITRGWETFRAALRLGGGLARRARFVMSHSTGKIEIQAVDKHHIYLRYHRAKDPAMRGKFLICPRRDDAYWLDDLDLSKSSYSPHVAFIKSVNHECKAELTLDELMED